MHVRETTAPTLNGTTIAPDAPGYDDARLVFNRAFDKRPDLIVRPTDASDVAAAVRWAAERDVPVAVRGGGHGFAGHGTTDEGVLIDMSAMSAIDIDPASRTAWAQAGATAGPYTEAAGAHGLATGFGDSGDVGLAGLTLGGGIGFLVRRHGLTIDSLLAAEVVTADGEIRTVDAEREPDLFWALRGGGGNFGVVTRLQFRLHEVGTVVGGMLIHPATEDVLTGLVDVALAAPDDLSVIAAAMVAPPAPFLPPEVHGQLITIIMPVFAGDPADADRVLAPLRGLAEPLVDALEPMPYGKIYEEGGPPPTPIAVRSGFADGLTADAAAEAIARLRTANFPMASFQFRVLGGAASRVPADATAFAHRDKPLWLAAAAIGAPLPDLEAWVSETAAATGMLGNGVYVNYLGGDSAERLAEAYPPATLARLREVKRAYDPDNVFRVNHNIAPAAA
jgi:FAD/FMN-containing dehydrogenase